MNKSTMERSILLLFSGEFCLSVVGVSIEEHCDSTQVHINVTMVLECLLWSCVLELEASEREFDWCFGFSNVQSS